MEIVEKILQNIGFLGDQKATLKKFWVSTLIKTYVLTVKKKYLHVGVKKIPIELATIFKISHSFTLIL